MCVVCRLTDPARTLLHPKINRSQVMDSFPEAYWRIKLAVLLVAERMKGPQSFWSVCQSVNQSDGWCHQYASVWSVGVLSVTHPTPTPTIHPQIRWPYLRNLPEKYAYMPIFYNNSEFGSIQIPSLMRTVQVGR